MHESCASDCCDQVVGGLAVTLSHVFYIFLGNHIQDNFVYRV